ncbi:heparan-alpha-glucosaminide N-acetyltransferase domain-containing protein [Aquimarina sp. MMG016]|uniref:heparan-alpha-glucosaminide N-acetyltransferase domain-containing protein n=1 Tax=Aquimarina sp. MMG016 TaxID=2822690 RepID=UPI001B39F333|nr:heparan-alpha-glucosaminide N-acetyltransferase domain-containing protein [Aquimarina sp. MMG016]MBQ4818495.1 DUF1624 domain-containing protein [Aquimarina sp. MMG016]
MTNQTNRLYFLDAIRAFAIVMMLQGHFVQALLEDTYRDRTSVIFSAWEYFRGMTAPTFFTITGFIFTFLLLKQSSAGLNNPRILKGVKRAIKLVFWGYLLRLSFFAVFRGTLNSSFFYVDVLQCIGTSLLLLIGLYLILYKYSKRLFQYTILGIGMLVFIIQPLYDTAILEFLPETIANYFTNKYGSIFTLLPWFGYVCFGGFLATIFLRYGRQQKFYPLIITSLLLLGCILVFYSSGILMLLHDAFKIEVFKSVAYNNFLFIRLGNVCILFSIFMLLRNYLTGSIFTKIGGKTLSIYIIHFFVLYGSWFGLGLNRFFYRALTPTEVVLGATLFVIGVCVLVVKYYKYETEFLLFVEQFKNYIFQKIKFLMSNNLKPNLIKEKMIEKYQNFRFGKR